MQMIYNNQVETDQLTDTLTVEQDIKSLMIWNDDVNTFDHVIQSLVEICGHTEIQAEQCAYFIHTLGKYDVKTGTEEKLLPQCEALLDRGISAEIY